ncbi:unnamed protein product [Parnassius apollo]|uniref:(apollo) hypothetical protein n=1 Tax=Parnassius apollo TaxID=110799 RepID=A0A8S3XX97_PARAO|nr:unnamed protein product [Parnassius apollo]
MTCCTKNVLRHVYVNALFPYLDNNKIQFPSAQRQPNNSIECGLFAICFSTALALRVNPSCINFIAEDMRRHLFDMLSRGVLELFPSTNTARRAGRPPANLFLNILAKKEKCKIKVAEKKKNKRPQKTQFQENESQNVNYKKNIEYPTFTDNTQIFESPTSTSITQIFESPKFTGSTQIIESPTFTDESQKDKNPTNNIQTIDCLALMYSTQEKPSPTLRRANNEHTGSGQAKRRRKNTDYTQTTQIRNTESHRSTRQIPVIIQAEQQRNMQAHRLARENPIFRDTEQQRNTHAHRIARENPVFRDIKQRRDTQAHQIAREHPYYSQIERARDTRARQLARCNSINDWDNVKRKYFVNTKEGYNHPCSCCGRLWHKNSVRKIIKHSISTKYNAEFALSVFNLNPCDESAEFYLNALPRSINDDNVITVELKRKFCYKHGRKEQVRPEIIRSAAEYLATCDLFRTYGIELEGSWTNNEPEDTVECTCSSSEQESNVDEIPDENQDLTIVMAPGEASSIETLNDSSQAINYSQAVEEVEAEGNWIPLQDNLGYIRKRTKTRVIRFRRYSYIDDPDNFYREQIMLYMPWRSKKEELLNPNINIKDIFDEYKERIKAESKQFNKLGDAEMFETLLTEIRNVELINEEEDLQGRGFNVDVFEGFEIETQTVDIAEELIPGGNPGPQLCVVVVGDFRQLPRVGDNWVFQANSRNPLAEIAGTPLWHLFVLTELKEIMRQRDDVALAMALNNMASGCMSPEDVNLIEGRCFSNSSLPDTCKDAVHLFSSNREVDEHNSKILSNMTTEGAISRAVDRVSGEANPAMKEKALNTVAKLPTSKSHG